MLADQRLDIAPGRRPDGFQYATLTTDDDGFVRRPVDGDDGANVDGVRDFVERFDVNRKTVRQLLVKAQRQFLPDNLGRKKPDRPIGNRRLIEYRFADGHELGEDAEQRIDVVPRRAETGTIALKSPRFAVSSM